MSKRKEKISAFLDNDLHQEELMSFSLSAESEDAQIAQRYQLIGDALRGELNNASFIDVSHAVREALAGENIADAVTKIADKPSRKADSRPSSVASSAWGFSGWFKPVAGLAFAVMVAVVMVLTISEQDGAALAPVATNIDTMPVEQGMSVADINQKPSGTVILQNAVADKKATDIDPYINQHLEYATQDALQGRLPYIRAVNYEAGK
jgi:negative regulator of sigma E activity